MATSEAEDEHNDSNYYVPRDVTTLLMVTLDRRPMSVTRPVIVIARRAVTVTLLVTNNSRRHFDIIHDFCGDL